MENSSIINIQAIESITQNNNGLPSKVTTKEIPTTTPDGKPWPKISIVTPSYNMEEYIEETILSVIGQNYPNLEYIIIDGGSKDGTVNIIKRYEPWISYWVSEPDNGMYHAIEKGFNKSTGEIMAWINSDDKYHVNAFFSVATIFSSMEEIDWITGRSSFYNDEGTIVDVNDLRKWSKFDYYLGNFKWIQQESTFWRRRLWLMAGSKINTNLKFAGDYELWLRFFRFAILYSAATIFAGFRYRSKDQLSLDHMDAYVYEVNQVTQLDTLPREDKYALKKIKFFQNVLFKIPFIRKFSILKRHYANTFNYPPKIVYDWNYHRFFKY